MKRIKIKCCWHNYSIFSLKLELRFHPWRLDYRALKKSKNKKAKSELLRRCVFGCKTSQTKMTKNGQKLFRKTVVTKTFSFKNICLCCFKECGTRCGQGGEESKGFTCFWQLVWQSYKKVCFQFPRFDILAQYSN